MLNEFKATILEYHAAHILRQMNHFSETLKQVEEFEKRSGFDLVQNRWEWSGPFAIKVGDLSQIRKIVGRLEVTGKDVPCDFEDTNEIRVCVKPKSDKWSKLSFSYRTKLRGKCCHVETVRSEYKTLVCKTGGEV